jgi:peptidoglycan/LPS O-acetylase OafA/YrhL
MIGLALVWYDTNMGWRSPHYGGGLPRLLSGFFCGMVIYHILRRKRLHVPRLPSAIAFLAFWAVQMPHVRFIGLPLFLVALPGILAVAVMAKRDRLAMALAPFAKRYTYGVYLTHYPVMLMCRRAAEAFHIDPDYQSSPLGYLVVLALVVAVGVMATRLAGVFQAALHRRGRQPMRVTILPSAPVLARYR